MNARLSILCVLIRQNANTSQWGLVPLNTMCHLSQQQTSRPKRWGTRAHAEDGALQLSGSALRLEDDGEEVVPCARIIV
jgi:hypothetical protein